MKLFGMLLFLFSLAVGFTACGEQDECLARFGCDEAFWEYYTPVQVCEDFCGGYGNYYARCGSTYSDGYAACQAFFAGSCNNVTSVNNKRTMYELCLPWFAEADCEVIGAGWLPDCNHQFTWNSGGA